MTRAGDIAEAGPVRDLLRLLQALVEAESPSRDEAANIRVAQLLEAEMKRAGGAVEAFAAPGLGVHLLGRFAGRRSDSASDKPLLLLGHMDTVHPAGTLDRFPFAVNAGRIEGPGAYDMKAGLAVALTALRALAASGTRPRTDVWLLVTCDEEIGSPDSRARIEASARLARAGLVLEPSAPGGAAKTRRKGVADYVLSVSGRSAHAGIEPEAGASAVHEIAHQIERIQAIEGLGDGTTINVGMVRGGRLGNVVADEATCAVDVRFWTKKDGDKADAALRALAPRDGRCSLQLAGGTNRGPLEKTKASALLFQRARRIAEGAGLALGESSTGGASDGNIASAAGLPVLDGLGPDGGGAHTLDEHVLLDDLPARVAFMAALLEEL